MICVRTLKYPAHLQADIAWERHDEEVQAAASASRYQRFLEEELGQLLQSQAPDQKGKSQQPERQLSRQAKSAERQTCRPMLPVKSAHSSSQEAKGQFMHAGGHMPQHDSQSRPCRAAPDRQHLTSMHNISRDPRLSHASSQQVSHPAGHVVQLEGQARLHTGHYDRHRSAISPHFSQSEQELQRSGHRHQADAQSALSESSRMSKLTHPSGSSAHRQKGAQPDAKPAHSQQSVNQQLTQHDGQSALNLASPSKPGQYSDSFGVDSEHAPVGMTSLAGDQHDPQQRMSDARDDGELTQQPRRRGLSHMRGLSPQRRQLVLQSRLALFDSDSSSSSDEEERSVPEVSTAY